MNNNIEKIILEEMNAFNINLIYIFGSYVRGNFTQKSDIDIAYYGELTIEENLDLIYLLESKLERKIDLINLKKSNENFLAEIVIEGKCMYYKNEEVRDNFEMRVLSNYLTLEEDRKIVIDAIYKRGSIYGKGSIE